MTNPLDAEARELLGEPWFDQGRFGLIQARYKAMAAVRAALEMRDAERAEVERLRDTCERAKIWFQARLDGVAMGGSTLERLDDLKEALRETKR